MIAREDNRQARNRRATGAGCPGRAVRINPGRSRIVDGMNRMYRTLRRTIKLLPQRTGLAGPVLAWWVDIRYRTARRKPVPPPHLIKAQVLRQYAAAYRLRILVETGTHYGEMLAALKNGFDRLYSIELLPEYHEKARRRFQADPQVELFCGDSAVVLPQVIARLQEPALFWLDGHHNQAPASGPITPILAELGHLLAAPRLGHVIVIDDARLFSHGTGYPELEEVLSIVAKDGGWEVRVQDDSIRLAPRAPGEFFTQ